MTIREEIWLRVRICCAIIVALFLIILGKIFYVQQVEGKYWIAYGDSLHMKYMPILGRRGNIYSADAVLLAETVDLFDVKIDFGAEGLREKNGKRFYENIDSLSILLSTSFGDKTPVEYRDELVTGYKNQDRYYPLKRKITYDDYQKLKQFPLIRSGRNKSGFIFEPRDVRYYPYLYANRTIGSYNKAPSGSVGLESSYDSVLRGVQGGKLVTWNLGKWEAIDGSSLTPENGMDLVTTIDSYMQYITDKALKRMLQQNNSIGGCAVVMETRTGKIKAISNLKSSQRYDDGTTDFNEMINDAVARSDEPGSLFKLATLISLLEDKFVTNNTIVDCEGGSKIFYGFKIRDSRAGTASISVKDAFAQNSNVAFAKLADQYYSAQPKKFIDHLHQLRLDTLTGIDIIASSGRPTIKTPNNRSWSASTIPFMAIGYECMVTPLHLVMLYNAVANNGTMMRPYLVSNIVKSGQVINTIGPQVSVQKICSEGTLKQVQECLQAVVNSSHGTAHKVIFDGTYAIAGKTSTSVLALDNKGYNRGNKIYRCSFVGYFPVEAPKYTVGVFITNSANSKMIYGADVAGSLFKEIADKIYQSSIKR